MQKTMLFALAVLSWAQALTAYGEETWKITSLEWPPYASEHLPHQGSAVKSLRDILAEQNIRLVVDFLPWKRARELARSKEYVGYFPAWPEEVTGDFTASEPVSWSQIGVLKLATTELHYNTIDELFKRYRVGVVSTYRYPEIITAAMQKYPGQVEGAMTELLLVRKLCGGRQAVAITDPRVMSFVAAEEGITGIETLEVIASSPLVLAFRNGEDNNARRRLLNRLLSQAVAPASHALSN